MTNNEEYNKRQSEISGAIKSGNYCALIGLGLLIWFIFSHTNIQLYTMLLIVSLLLLWVVWSVSKSEFEKLSSYISALKTREEYLTNELKKYHTYIEKEEKRKFVNL